MKFLYVIFASCCVLNALSAYSVLSVPLPWIANSLMISALLIGFCQNKLSGPPHLKLMVALLGWAVFVTLLNYSSEYENLMPQAATTTYPIFVLLRFLDVAVFASTVAVTYSLCCHGYKDSIMRWIVLLGTAASLAAIYIYIAQLHGWPEPPRTRLGTGGEKVQTAVFSYAFHRATGTFREPSHLAEWLLVPLFLSAAYKRSLLNIHALAMCSALLLTGSMNGVVGLSGGLTVSLVLYSPFRRKNIRNFGIAALLLAIAILIFYAVAQSYDSTEFSLFGTIFDRLEPLITAGIGGTNRDYVYEYIWMYPPPFLGYGTGNGNLVFSDYLGSAGVASFLNIVVNTAYNLGIPGVALTVAILVLPVRDIYRRTFFGDEDYIRWFLGAYIACCVLLMAHTEFLNMQFGFVYGLLSFLTSREKVCVIDTNDVDFGKTLSSRALRRHSALIPRGYRDESGPRKPFRSW